MHFVIFQTVEAQTEALVDFSNASISEIQAYVDEGVLNYETITRIYLERIAAYNDDYKSIITVNPNAIEEAKALDLIFKEEGRLSELHGIPMVIKDNIDVKGMPTTAGAKGLQNNIAKEDAEVVAKLRDAGAIFIAKANMDEFAFNGGMSSSMFGLVRNAYSFNTTSYGSSGGTASAVASNLAVVGLGTDTGVSIRVPSAANNLYGLRPTKESVGDRGIINFEFLRVTVGPMAKYASDAKLVYDIMSNSNDETSYDLSTMRIGIIRSEINKAPGFLQSLINNKIKVLKEKGVTFVDVGKPNLDYSFNANNFCYDFNQYIKGTTGPIQSFSDLISSGEYTQWIDGYQGYFCNNDYTKTQEFKSYLSQRNSNIASANSYFKNNNVDAVLYPTLTETLQGLSGSIFNSMASYSYAIAPQTGFPALNIPVGFNDGLPYGMELVATKNSDMKLLHIAEVLDTFETSYKLPSISPSLYTPIPQIPVLKERIAVKHKQAEYKEVQNTMQYFLDNYANMQNREATADKFLAMYDNVENVLVEKKRV